MLSGKLCLGLNELMCHAHMIWFYGYSEMCIKGLPRQVVFHDRENQHDFVKTVPENW